MILLKQGMQLALSQQQFSVIKVIAPGARVSTLGPWHRFRLCGVKNGVTLMFLAFICKGKFPLMNQLQLHAL